MIKVLGRKKELKERIIVKVEYGRKHSERFWQNSSIIYLKAHFYRRFLAHFLVISIAIFAKGVQLYLAHKSNSVVVSV